MSDLITALGMVLVIEGALYALFPEGMRKMMRQALSLPPQALRAAGLAAAIAGFGIVWLVRG
jgi:hypothetical protein